MFGSTLRRTPHRVTIVKPTEVTDSDTNVTKHDYDTPVSIRQVQGLLQITSGIVSVGSEGQVYDYDAMFYTHDTGVEPNDRIETSDLTWIQDDFLVLAAHPKTKVSGALDHTEVVLKRDAKR